MAGPEDSTTSGHHHGNSSDTSDLRLQDSEEDSLIKEKHNSTPPVEGPSRVMNASRITADTETVPKTGDPLKIDMREGRETKHNTERPPAPTYRCNQTDHIKGEDMNRASQAAQTSDLQTSQPVCQADEASDVFDVSGHPYLFFFEDDSDDDVPTPTEEQDLGDAVFVDSDTQNRIEATTNAGDQRFSSRSDGPEDVQTPGDPPGLRDIPRSAPWTIPSGFSSSPGLTTVCRCSHGSQVVVRCQIVPSTCSDVRRVSSCPAAFSSVWTQVMDKEGSAALPEDGHGGGRKRLNTVSFNQTQPSPGQQEDLDLDPESPQRDPAQVHFKTRGRSYSDSDVQRLLIKEMSRELRRMGDEFNYRRGRRMTTVSEPIMEENGVFEM